MALGAGSTRRFVKRRFVKRSAPTVAEILSPLAESLTTEASRQRNLGAIGATMLAKAFGDASDT